MNRRNFLRNGSFAGISITSVTSLQFKKNKDEAEDKRADNFELIEATIDDLQQQMQTGKLTSAAITRMYLKRIEVIDKSGPYLNAVIEINPDAINIAEALDTEKQAKYAAHCMAFLY